MRWFWKSTIFRWWFPKR